MNWDVRHPVRVVMKGEKYHVQLCDDWWSPIGHNRYYTDDTLPDEIKAKLGMALFGMRGNGIDDVVYGKDKCVQSVDMWIRTRTFHSIRGEMRRDTRSKSKSASAQNPE